MVAKVLNNIERHKFSDKKNVGKPLKGFGGIGVWYHSKSMMQ